MPLDFSGGPNVIITRDFRRGRQEEQAQKEMRQQEPRRDQKVLHGRLESWGKGLQAKECGRLQKLEKKSRKPVPPLGFQEPNQGAEGCLDFSPGRPCGTSDLQIFKIRHLGCGKPPSVWSSRTAVVGRSYGRDLGSNDYAPRPPGGKRTWDSRTRTALSPALELTVQQTRCVHARTAGCRDG